MMCTSAMRCDTHHDARIEPRYIHAFFCIAIRCDAIRLSHNFHNCTICRAVAHRIATQGPASYCESIFRLCVNTDWTSYAIHDIFDNTYQHGVYIIHVSSMSQLTIVRKICVLHKASIEAIGEHTSILL